VPRGKGPFPAALLLSGSGPQDRDETIFGHKPFLVIADQLTRHGIAVLRVDDRGVGGSSGSTFNATLDDNVADALACLAFLQERKEIDARRIGIIGHSEGGYVAPLAATRADDVAFLVLLAGPGLSGEDILYAQGATILKSLGAAEDALKKQRALQELIFTALKEESDNSKAIQLIRDRLKKMQEKANPLEQIQWALAQKQLDAQMKTVTTPWFRFFLTYDPRPALRKLRAPVLVMIGDKDVQVPPKENFAALERAFLEGNSRHVTLKEMPGLNHLFQTAKTGALAEYGRIEETFAPAALDLMTEWIGKRTSER
jgi:pimeloyl-ACP methyl ester carboxylesterase